MLMKLLWEGNLSTVLLENYQTECRPEPLLPIIQKEWFLNTLLRWWLVMMLTTLPVAIWGKNELWLTWLARALLGCVVPCFLFTAYLRFRIWSNYGGCVERAFCRDQEALRQFLSYGCFGNRSFERIKKDASEKFEQRCLFYAQADLRAFDNSTKTVSNKLSEELRLCKRLLLRFDLFSGPLGQAPERAFLQAQEELGRNVATEPEPVKT